MSKPVNGACVGTGVFCKALRKSTYQMFDSRRNVPDGRSETAKSADVRLYVGVAKPAESAEWRFDCDLDAGWADRTRTYQYGRPEALGSRRLDTPVRLSPARQLPMSPVGLAFRSAKRSFRQANKGPPQSACWINTFT
ncbi:MAG: hypothetical protein AB8B91_19530, partial [Rubripirellula sp.]